MPFITENDDVTEILQRVEPDAHMYIMSVETNSIVHLCKNL